MTLLRPRCAYGMKHPANSDPNEHDNQDCERQGTHFLQTNIGEWFSTSHSNNRKKVKSVEDSERKFRRRPQWQREQPEAMLAPESAFACAPHRSTAFANLTSTAPRRNFEWAM